MASALPRPQTKPNQKKTGPKNRLLQTAAVKSSPRGGHPCYCCSCCWCCCCYNEARNSGNKQALGPGDRLRAPQLSRLSVNVGLLPALWWKSDSLLLFFGRGVGKSCISFLCTWKCIIFRPEYSSKFSVIKLSNSVSQVLSSARKLPSIAQLRCIP